MGFQRNFLSQSRFIYQWRTDFFRGLPRRSPILVRPASSPYPVKIFRQLPSIRASWRSLYILFLRNAIFALFSTHFIFTSCIFADSWSIWRLWINHLYYTDIDSVIFTESKVDNYIAFIK